MLLKIEVNCTSKVELRWCERSTKHKTPNYGKGQNVWYPALYKSYTSRIPREQIKMLQMSTTIIQCSQTVSQKGMNKDLLIMCHYEKHPFN